MNENYYDFDMPEVETILIQNGMIDDIFYLKDLKQRKLFLNSEITQTSVSDTIHQIMQFNKEDKGIEIEKRHPILLYITSVGGEVDSGFALIDIIQSSKTPVYTVNVGFNYSMGFLIGLAGHKRYAFKNSKFLHHDGFSGAFNSGSKVIDQIEFNKAGEERIKKYVLSVTKIPEKLYNKKQRTEWYMFADEAKELGVTDCIIGVDCDIDEVI